MLKWRVLRRKTCHQLGLELENARREWIRGATTMRKSALTMIWTKSNRKIHDNTNVELFATILSIFIFDVT